MPMINFTDRGQKEDQFKGSLGAFATYCNISFCGIISGS